MNKFVGVLIVIFLILFVIQQSNVIEKKTVRDQGLGVNRDEYHLNLDNLRDYLNDIPGKIQKFLPQKRGK